MNITQALKAIQVLVKEYRGYIKFENSIYVELCDTERIIQNRYERSSNDFKAPANLEAIKTKFPSINSAYKCCFIEHSTDINSKLLCYHFLLDIHKSPNNIDVTLDISPN